MGTKKENLDMKLKGFRTPGLTPSERMAYLVHGKLADISKKWITHLFLLLAIISYNLLGALLYSIIEGGPEAVQVEEIINHRQAVMAKIQDLVTSGSPKLMEKSEALIKVYEGQLMESFGQNSRLLVYGDNQLNWDFWGSAFFCGTVYTMIGISAHKPITTTGRALTIFYTLIGIPLFLTLLADFGKLLTKWIKYLWIHVRRMYYTGSCRKPNRARKDYDDDDDDDEDDDDELTGIDFDVEETTDDFSLPISIAMSVFFIWIFFGTVLYYLWEPWNFYESFYFIFIVMSTVGFGDFVPTSALHQMALIVYLAFGLCLTSMCVNVVREKIQETFTQATSKLGESVGLEMAGGAPEGSDEMDSIDIKRSTDRSPRRSVVAQRGFPQRRGSLQKGQVPHLPRNLAAQRGFKGAAGMPRGAGGMTRGGTTRGGGMTKGAGGVTRGALRGRGKGISP